MSYERFTSFFKERGCRVSLRFNQGWYFNNFCSIKAKSLDSNTNTVVRSNLPEGGMCLGFALVMIEQHFNFSNFLSALETAEGKGKIRGYVFMQYIQRMQPSGDMPKHFPGDDIIYSKIYELNSYTFTMAMSKNFEQVGYQGGKYWGIMRAAAFIQERMNSYFFLGVCSDKLAHALALTRTKDSYGFFDPNYGMAEFPKNRIGNALAFCYCLETYLEELYTDFRPWHSYHITAFRSKKQPIATMQIT